MGLYESETDRGVLRVHPYKPISHGTTTVVCRLKEATRLFIPVMERK